VPSSLVISFKDSSAAAGKKMPIRRDMNKPHHSSLFRNGQAPSAAEL
jgi:hypothetical protein